MMLRATCRVLHKLPQYIEQLDDDTLLIRDVSNFFTYALLNHFGGMKVIIPASACSSSLHLFLQIPIQARKL